MTNPELVAPSLRYFDSWQESNAEWAGAHQDGSAIRVADAMGLDLSRPADFALWVQQMLVEADPSYSPPDGRVNATTLWIVEGDTFLGSVNVRHTLNDYLALFGGHIGYGIRPSARRRGLARLCLQHALVRAKRLGLERVLLTCYDTNEGSYRTIEGCGGILERVVVPDDMTRSFGVDDALRRYWIQT